MTQEREREREREREKEKERRGAYVGASRFAGVKLAG